MAALLLLAGAAAGWIFGRPMLARRHDVAERRSTYRSFPTFPGATKADDRSYEIRGDGEGTGEYGLTVTYRLPASTVPSEVIRFFRESIPPSWHEATDETCADVASRMIPPPAATLPAGSPASMAPPPTSAFRGRLVLTRSEGELAVFAPSVDRPGEGRFSGVTFKVSSSGQDKFLTLDEVTFGCEPPV